MLCNVYFITYILYHVLKIKANMKEGDKQAAKIK